MKIVVLDSRNGTAHVQRIPPGAQETMKDTIQYIHDRYHKDVEWMATTKDPRVEKGVCVDRRNRSRIPVQDVQKQLKECQDDVVGGEKGR